LLNRLFVSLLLVLRHFHLLGWSVLLANKSPSGTLGDLMRATLQTFYPKIVRLEYVLRWHGLESRTGIEPAINWL
jgi:hypothetical protein